MTEEELSFYSKNEILSDFKSIYNCLQICLKNDVNVYVYQSIMPFLCSRLYAGLKYLKKQNPRLVIDKEFWGRLSKSRSKFLKEYTEFKENSYNKLKSYIEKESNKFFEYEKLKNENVLRQDINNYFITTYNNKPIDNYHLRMKILCCDIGVYNEDIKTDVGNFVEKMCNYLSCVIGGPDRVKTPKKLKLGKFVIFNLNISHKYENFNISDAPILIVLLDILCTINSFIEIFTLICENDKLFLKTAYLILFDSILGLHRIIDFCQENNININISDDFKNKILLLEEKYCKNCVRRHCAHYGFDSTYLKDPITEIFESKFEGSLNAIRQDIFAKLKDLSNILYAIIFKYPLGYIE